MKTDRLTIWLALSAVLLFGAYVRLAGLGRADLSHDELIHYFTAQGLERNAGPTLPSGEEYRRGLDVTRLAGLGARLTSDTELGARLPTALFGILNLVLMAAIGWAIGGPWGAVVATLLLAIYPEAVARSRGIRFYTYQLNFGLIALFATWQVVRHAGSASRPSRTEMRASWLWSAAAAITFGLAARVQVTTLSVLAGAALAVLVAAVADLIRHGRAAWRFSTPLHLASAGVLLALLTMLIAPQLVSEVVAQSQHQPLWARTNQGSVLAYYYMLSDSFPLLIALAPALFLVVALRDIRLGVFLACWFGVPFLLHSLAFPWKGERFIMLAMPALFLVAGIAVVAACGALRRAIAARTSTGLGDRLGQAAVAVVVMFALMATPAFNRARAIPSGASEPMVRRERWHSAAELLEKLPGVDSIPIGSSTPLATLHYMGRADFAVRRDALERPIGHLASSPELASLGMVAVGSRHAQFPQGTPDYYSGAPVLTTPEAIRNRFASRGEVILVVDSTRWAFGDIEPALKSTLLTEAAELCRGHCGALLVFRWSFGASRRELEP